MNVESEDATKGGTSFSQRICLGRVGAMVVFSST